jgi:hypothetical protein
VPNDSQQQNFANIMRPKYEASVKLWAQQLKPMTSGLVVETSEQGAEQLAEDFFGITTMRKMEQADSDVKKSKLATMRRWIFADDYFNQIPLRRQDQVRMAVDPTSGVAQAQVAAANRTLDLVAFSAMLGNAYTGKTMSTPVALPAGGTIADLNTGFTLPKFDAMQAYLKKYGMLEPGDRINAAWTQFEETTFINVNEVASYWFSTDRPRDKGYVGSYGLVDFYRIEDVFDMDGTLIHRMLPYGVGTGTGGANVRTVLAWVQKAVKRWTPLNVEGLVDWDPGPLEYLITTMRSTGATRRMDRGVVAINCITTDS